MCGEFDLKTCIDCRSRHGQIYSIDEVVNPSPPLHVNCRCDIIPLESAVIGTYINPLFNSMGIGSLVENHVVQLIRQKYHIKSLISTVLIDNIQSYNYCIKNGYEEITKDENFYYLKKLVE